jgi:hypothetical protein
VREAIDRAATLRASSRPVLASDRTLGLEAGSGRLLVHYRTFSARFAPWVEEG